MTGEGLINSVSGVRMNQGTTLLILMWSFAHSHAKFLVSWFIAPAIIVIKHKTSKIKQILKWGHKRAKGLPIVCQINLSSKRLSKHWNHHCLPFFLPSHANSVLPLVAA